MPGPRRDKEIAWSDLRDYLARQVSIVDLVRLDVPKLVRQRQAANVMERLGMLQSKGEIPAHQVHRILRLISAVVAMTGIAVATEDKPSDPPAE